MAIRRRFGLLHIEPQPQVVQEFWREPRDFPFGTRLVALMNRLNGALDQIDRGGEFRVGQSYFLANPSLPDLQGQIARKWRHQVFPLLQEYGQLLNLREDFFRNFPEDFVAALR